MQDIRKTIFLIALLLAAALMAGCSSDDNGTNNGDDNGDNVSATNRIRLDCPVTIDSPAQDTEVDLDVYLTCDKNVGAFSLGFVHNSTTVEIDTFLPGPALTGNQSMFGNKDESANTVLVGWADFSGSAPIPPSEDVLAFTLVFRVPAGAPAQSINVDSIFVAPAGNWLLAFEGGTDARPALDDCSSADIIIR